jgi:hypothetical protein
MIYASLYCQLVHERVHEPAIPNLVHDACMLLQNILLLLVVLLRACVEPTILDRICDSIRLKAFQRVQMMVRKRHHLVVVGKLVATLCSIVTRTGHPV